jgi:predicted alpha/beta superfamily hydrolase
MQSELFPLIQRNYSVSDQRTIVGQSLGGLLATEVLFKHPEMFQRYVIVSPSLWWDNESLLDYMPASYEAETVYIAVGEEGEIMKRTARELFEVVADEFFGEASFDFLKEYNHANIGHEAVFRGLDKVWK